MKMCLKISAMGKIYLNLHKYIVLCGHGGNAQFQFSFFSSCNRSGLQNLPTMYGSPKYVCQKTPLYLPVLYSRPYCTPYSLGGGGEGGQTTTFHPDDNTN